MKYQILFDLPFMDNFKLPKKESCSEKNNKNLIISQSFYGISLFGQPLCVHSDFKVVLTPECGSSLAHTPLKDFWVFNTLKC